MSTKTRLIQGCPTKGIELVALLPLEKVAIAIKPQIADSASADFKLQQINLLNTGLLNIGNPEAHETLILIGLIFGKLVNRLSAAEPPLTPAGLTTLIGK
ncbi:hypothetical protein H6H02_06105 [Coleofasciculus sp. FACHB-1120]|nr:hypothetical protein [Coleofasciculus sp. FACHB-1120]